MGNIPTATAAALGLEIELINEAIDELNVANLQAFMNIPRVVDDINGEKAEQLGKSLLKLLMCGNYNDEMKVFEDLAEVTAEGRRSPFTGLLEEGDVLRKIARELNVSSDDLKDVLSADDGVTGLFEYD